MGGMEKDQGLEPPPNPTMHQEDEMGGGLRQGEKLKMGKGFWGGPLKETEKGNASSPILAHQGCRKKGKRT